MSTISLERLSILLVEDNLYIRDILESVLKQIGFGWVATARNSQEGIEFLQIAGKSQGQAAELMNVDMILCNLGVAEFIAKLFSAQSISERVMKVIENPRQFVTCTTYFGPDRRRRKAPPPGGIEDRRRTDDKHATIVYSAEKVVKPKSPSDVWYFRLPNTLRDKVGGAGVKGPLRPRTPCNDRPSTSRTGRRAT